ncbi:MAG TPA: hypothetical protein VEI47_03725 [Gemmatimonadales bacterium]|jgi:Ni/Co efflux regulator RcnB|nr:hypothetical protein [Gemmatimonadales bacterium]
MKRTFSTLVGLLLILTIAPDLRAATVLPAAERTSVRTSAAPGTTPHRRHHRHHRYHRVNRRHGRRQGAHRHVHAGHRSFRRGHRIGA